MIGQTISHYRITEKIGEGGMGEVYLAEDISLPRKVALKFLPSSCQQDEIACKRFLREAESAARLDHPFICSIKEVARTDSGQDFIVMEYVEGRTLKARLAEGPLPLKQALQVGVEVAEALEVAHQRGIVHRDLKPANIILTPQGHAKIMDFGLAKKVITEEGRQEDLTSALTREGSTLGTPAYMSPEQIRAQPLDHRSDIFSFGIVLYEMLTGVHPFRKNTQSETAAAILGLTPVLLSRYLDDAPQLLDHILGKMLAKAPEDRYQLIHEFATDLRKVTAPPPVGALKVQRWPGIAVFLAVLAIGLTCLYWFYWRTRSESAVPPMNVVPLTSYPGIEERPSLSPDGNQVAFAWNGEQQDNFDIYVKLIGTETPLRLTTDPARDTTPAWSPDGGQIAFARFSERGSGIFVVPALGGPERKLHSFSYYKSGFGGFGLDWSPDGQFIAFPDKDFPEAPDSIFLLSVQTLETRKLTSSSLAEDASDFRPSFSPDSQTLAFCRTRAKIAGGIYLAPLSGGEPRHLTDGHCPNWTADGRELLFAQDGELWRIRVSGGEPDRLGIMNADFSSLSRQGNRLAYESQIRETDIWRAQLSGGEAQKPAPTALIASTREDSSPHISPDGERIVFCSTRSTARFTIWICDSNGSNPVQLTSGRGGSPQWSPNGRFIAFDALHEGQNDIHIIRREGGQPTRLTTDPADDTVPSWSRDGRWIYFASKRSGDWQVWKMEAEGGQPPVQVTQQGGFAPQESPDGKSVYYVKGLEVPGIWKVPVAGGEETMVLEQAQAGYWGWWSVVDKGLYFLNTEVTPWPAIEFLDFATEKTTRTVQLSGPPRQWNRGLAVSPDETWILCTQWEEPTCDLMLVENFR